MTKSSGYLLERYFGPGCDELIRHTPHARFLGMEVVEAAPRQATLRISYRSELVGDPARAVVFGGVVTALLDQAAGLAVGCSMEQPRAIATIDLRIDYLRAAEPGRDIYGQARCYKATRNVAFVRAVAYDADVDDPFASCLATFMLGANRAPSSYERLVRAGDAGDAGSSGCQPADVPDAADTTDSSDSPDIEPGRSES